MPIRPLAAAILFLTLAMPFSAGAQTSGDPLAGLSSLVTACGKGDSCTVVDSLPCGCASGGSPVAINAHYAKFWQALQRDLRRNAPPVFCPQVYRCVPGARAACVQGRCIVRAPR